MAAQPSYKDRGSPQHFLVFELLENLHALMKAFGGCGGSGGKGLPSATSVGGCGGRGGKGLPSARKAGDFRSKFLPAWLTNELSGSTINTASSESTVSVTSFFMDEPSSSAV